MIRVLLLLTALAAAPAAAAQRTPAEAAEAAAGRLEEASRMLDAAQDSDDRVAALTETIRAYEDGLVAMRDGLRRAAVRERAIEIELDSRSEEIAQLLGVLETMGRTPAPVTSLHPGGALGTARSGMILADVTPALQARADRLRGRLEEVQTLRRLQESAADTLQKGLAGAQEARTKLSEAISERRDLPRRYTEDEVATALLIASTETLEGFASGLSQTVASDGPAPPPDASARRGELDLPVQGTILRAAGEADAAGITRPGLLLATPPRAIVTAPAAATIRYRGPLLDLGQVVILEPAQDVLIILAGLAETYGSAGEIVAEGAPVGVMGGDAPDSQAILSDAASGADAVRSETLYIEVREEQDAVDPSDWFDLPNDAPE